MGALPRLMNRRFWQELETAFPIMASDLQTDFADPLVPVAPLGAKPKILFFFKALICMGLVRYKYFSAAVSRDCEAAPAL